MSNKQPNRFIAPIVIAGITIGFLASAYKFVFAKSKKPASVVQNQETPQPTEQQSLEQAPEKTQIQS